MFAIILTILFATFAHVAWHNFRGSLILLAGLLPIYLIRFDIGPIPGTALEVLIFICFAVWLIRYRSFSPAILSPWIKPLGLLLLAATIGVVVANDTTSALGIWKAYFIEPVLVFVMFKTTLKKEDWPKVFKAISISAIIVSIFAIFQFTTGLAIPAPWDIERRVTGIFDYPNALGLFLAPIVAMNAVLLFAPLSPPMTGEKTRSTLPQIWGSRRGQLTTIILGTIAIILAQTEAAFVAIPGALLITYLLAPLHPPMTVGKTRSTLPQTWRSRRGQIAIVISTLLIVLAFAVPITRQKLLLQDYSGQVRLSQWSETTEMLKENLIFGAGLNGYSDALTPYHDPTFYEIFQYPHNIILNIWTELGLLGLIAFFWLTILVIREIRSNAPSGSLMSGGETMKFAIFAALAVMVIHGLVDVPYFKNDLSVLTMILLAGISKGGN